MTNKDSPNDLKRRIHKMEKEVERLNKELEKEREVTDIIVNQNENLQEQNTNLQKQNAKLKKEKKDLEEQLSQLKGSLPHLAASDKTAEAAGVPTSKIFYRRNRQEGKKRKTGGQPGHKGHGRKRPTPTMPPIHVTLFFCPYCSNQVGKKVKGAEQKRTVTDIPFPSYDVYEIIYDRHWCGTCEKLVRGETPWIPSNQQYGPGLASWIAYHRMLGLSVDKIRSSLYETYGLKLSEAAVLKLEKWVADTLQGDYQKLREELLAASSANADETKFRVGGENGWLWVFTHILGSFYVVAPTRGHAVPEEILEGFEGVLGRDAWKPYDVVNCADHQLDILHVNRWLERAEIKHRFEPRSILTSKPAKLTKPGRPPEHFIEFVDGVRSILKRAIEYTEKKPPPSVKEREEAYKHFHEEMKMLLDREWVDKDVIRISKELRKRLNMLFTFVKYEGVPWHNNDAERAIRQGVLARKISGGRRTWTGAEIFQVLLSISETAKKKGKNFIELVKEKIFSSSVDCTEHANTSKS